MLVRLEDEGVDALKQFLKDFGHKRDRDNTAIIFPDGEVIHVDDHGESVLQINAWWGKNRRWQSDSAPERELIRIGIHEDFATGNGCILYALAKKPFSTQVASAIEGEISVRPYLTEVCVEFEGDYSLAEKRFQDRFDRLLAAGK